MFLPLRQKKYAILLQLVRSMFYYFVTEGIVL
jgi:hypothetical protein